MNSKTLLPLPNRFLSKYLRAFLLLTVSVFVVWFFGRSLNWANVRTSISQADPKVLGLAILVICLTYLLRAYRWRFLLNPITDARLRDLFIATVVGFSAFLVFGRAGEIVRPAILPLRDRRVPPTAAFITIFLERICDFVAIVLLFALNLLWFQPTGSALEFSTVRKVGFALLIASLSGVLLMFWFARRASAISRRIDLRRRSWPTLFKRVIQIALNLIEQLSAALQVLANPRQLIGVVFWTATVWLTIVAGNLLTIRSFSVPFGFRETVFVLGWALVGSLVPTPGGSAGTFHAAAAAGLIFLGIGKELAAAIAILIHLVDFAPAIVFALFYIIRGEVTAASIRQSRAEEVDAEDLIAKRLVSDIP